MVKLKGEMTLCRLKANGTTEVKGLELEELGALLRGGRHKSSIEGLRQSLRNSAWDGNSRSEYTDDVPYVVPGARLKNSGSGLTPVRLSGLVLLDIRNVETDEDLRRLKAAVGTLPMTAAAFMGSSGLTFKVLVRTRPVGDRWPVTGEETEAYCRAAHEQMRAIYAAVLPPEFAIWRDTSVTDGFRLSIDAEALLRPDAVAAQVDAGLTFRQPAPLAEQFDPVEANLQRQRPVNPSSLRYYDGLFAQMEDEVSDAFRAEGRSTEKEPEAFLAALARHAAERDVALPEVRARMVLRFGWMEPEEVRRQVERAYAEKAKPKGTGRRAADATRGMIETLQGSYEFYRNTVNGHLYLRERTTFGTWRRVDKGDVNSLTLEVKEAGYQVSDHDVRTYLYSQRIPVENPIDRLVRRLRGTWDGQDRIEALARRVPTHLRQWPRWFHIWFTAMVAQWISENPDHGNEVAPLLVGPQGAGKSTFCRRLLPPELTDGYLDHLDLAKETEVLRSMALFQLINIDEFNRYSPELQRGKLKNYMQMNDIRLRTPYQQTFERRHRMASFIATCNPVEVLADETGSRRFLCVEVDGHIDNLTPIDYDQLYAQAIDELEQRRTSARRQRSTAVAGRTHFTPAEEAAIEQNNRRFHRLSGAVELFATVFDPQPVRKPFRQADGTLELLRQEILEQLNQRSRTPLTAKDRTELYAHLHNLAKDGKIAHYRTRKGMVYALKLHLQP